MRKTYKTNSARLIINISDGKYVEFNAYEPSSEVYSYTTSDKEIQKVLECNAWYGVVFTIDSSVMDVGDDNTDFVSDGNTIVIEDVTNFQRARIELRKLCPELDNKQLNNAESVRCVAKSMNVSFPNWN